MVNRSESPCHDNADEIARLQRWRMRASISFFGSIGWVLLTCVGSCAATGFINMNHLGLNYAYIAMCCGIVLPLAGLAGALLSAFDRRHAARALALAELADELGLKYSYKPDPDDVAFLADFTFINLARVLTGQAGADKNLLLGTFKKRPIVAVDYSFNHFYGNKVLNTRQTIVAFPQEMHRLPDFAVVGQSFSEKLEQSIAGTPLGRRIKVPDEAEFNRAFTVAGQDRAAVLACLSSEVIDLLLDDKQLTFVIQDGRLLVARQRVTVAAADYEQFLETASRLARELECAGH